MKESVASGILKYSVSTWVNLFIGFFSVIITTRIIDPENYGYITLFISASSVLVYFFSLGLDGALIRFYNEPPRGDTKSQLLYKSIIFSTLFCLIFTVIGVLFFYTSISDYLFGICSRFLVGCLFLQTFCSVILRYLNISFRMGFKVREYTIQNILVNSLTRVLMIVAAFISNSYVFIISVMSIGLLIVLLIYLYIQKNEIIPFSKDGRLDLSIKYDNYGEYFKFALFSAPTYIIVYLNTYLSQQIIKTGLGAYALGVFSSAGVFCTILSALQGGFSNYWSAYVYKNYKEEKTKIIEMHDYVLLFSIFICAALVCSRDIIYLIIGRDFHESKDFFSLLLVLPILNFVSETTAKGIAIAKKNQITMVIHTIAVAINVALCWLFTRSFGLIGAAIASSVSAFFLYALNSFFGQKYYKSVNSYPRSILGVIILVLVLLVPSVTHQIIIILFCSSSLVLLSAVIYKKQLITIFNLLKQRFSK